MIRLTQRQINHGVFGLLNGLALIAIGFSIFPTPQWHAIIPVLAGLAFGSSLWFAYWRGWEPARPLLILLLTVIVALGTAETFIATRFNHTLYTIPALALVLTGPVWVAGSALTLLVAFAIRGGGGPYLNPFELLTFVLVIGGMIFSRLAVDNAQRLEAAKREAEEARTRAEQRERDLAAQAEELAQRNVEQQRLLELVSALETPTIALAESVLLAPIVGALDTRRAQALTTRLLNDASAQRAQHVILDISGVTAVDTQVAQALIQTARALSLIGCRVTLTGISATVAMTLTNLGVALESIHTVRSPQEALAARTEN
ncbi:STAS domain-containing protein [Roseiflexus castenholzii]|uniref:Anti-sigma-factor antagonist n=1 Tax=Roseiflexus castenholzii (strain DSM 13941 / HLO8) TaxID=383372 RepID=A7NQP8_ROSCS|nr:STAS domain-containing protein [Roseiflexus castenholzii]ABU59894.1 anti-sigma-factor antagonist [Roseiflexus castenholzii DSM 13941]